MMGPQSDDFAYFQQLNCDTGLWCAFAEEKCCNGERCIFPEECASKEHLISVLSILTLV